jgi:ubiquinone/menaquinone biosynthesis C-methylase UbiE
MPVPFAVNDRFFAFYYPKLVGLSERAGQAQRRRELLATAVGRTLEIGAGNGHNLEHYPSCIDELVISEPSPFMIEHLRGRLASIAPPVGSSELVRTGAEELPFPDAHFDTVVGTFVHCTIPDPRRAIAEIERVLKPGGRYLFMEHVRSDRPVHGRIQDLLETPHRFIAAGCRPNRRTEQLLAESDLHVDWIVHEDMPRAVMTVRPTIRGSAIKPAQA